MTLLDRVGNLLEGRGRSILYAFGGLVVAVLVVIVFIKWNGRKNDEARQALGRAINISGGSIAGATTPGSATGPTFGSEQERAQKAIEEFEKVAAKYGDPYKTEARYFIATNRLSLDRPKAIGELTELANSKIPEVAVLSKFALAQATEADGKPDEAARIYAEVARLNNEVVTAETANLRLAKVYQKQGKKKEAADLLFAIVDASRKLKGKDGLPLPPSAAARDAADELQKLDPDRYAQLPPEASPLG